MFHEVLATFFILTFSSVIESAPGIAGAPWTDEEVGLVKAKLWSMTIRSLSEAKHSRT